MKALVWEAPRWMNTQEQAEPSLRGRSPHQVAYAGICGSELSGYLGTNALRVPPLVMGHEFAGEIVAIGEEARVHYPQLQEGQNVTVNLLSYDGTCEFCRRGHNHLCVSRKLIGAHRPGAFAEFVSVPAELVL